MDTRDAGRSAMIWTGHTYYENMDLEFALDDDTGKIIGFAQNVSEPVEWPELKTLAEKWAEYLGCTVKEDSTNPETENSAETEEALAGFSAEEKKDFYTNVETLMKKGYSEAEAYREALEMWGLNFGKVYGYDGYMEKIRDTEIRITLCDEGGEIAYSLWYYMGEGSSFLSIASS